MKTPARWFWIGAGTLSLITGIIGIFLPLLPTTPFLLLTAFCYSKGSPRLHHWMMTHPKLGPPVRDWNENRVIKKSAKWFATICIAGSISIPVFVLPTIPVWAKAAAASCSLAVLAFIWSQKSESQPKSDPAH